MTEFITKLKLANAFWMGRFANTGYVAAGGIGTADLGAADNAVKFINSFADKFGEALAAGEESLRWRALMYPREGHRLAYVLGQQAAMQERGARAWKRQLHPELSKEGPCDACIADSAIIHPIEDDFELLHPGDVCSVHEVIAYFPEPPEMVAPGTTPVAQMPVPELPTQQGVIQMLKDSLGKLGRGVKSIVRRIRG